MFWKLLRSKDFYWEPKIISEFVHLRGANRLWDARFFLTVLKRNQSKHRESEMELFRYAGKQKFYLQNWFFGKGWWFFITFLDPGQIWFFQGVEVLLFFPSVSSLRWDVRDGSNLVPWWSSRPPNFSWYFWSNYSHATSRDLTPIATSHEFSTPNGGLVREIPLFQENLGGWNIIPFGIKLFQVLN